MRDREKAECVCMKNGGGGGGLKHGIKMQKKRKLDINRLTICVYR